MIFSFKITNTITYLLIHATGSKPNASDSIYKFKRPRLTISRIDGQARKIENPDNLPEEHLLGTIFENVIVIF